MGYTKVSPSRGVTRSVGDFHDMEAELLVECALEVIGKRAAQ
jgi:hypothetical protein